VIVKQQFATSLDGTKIPYFLVYRNDFVFESTKTTILYGYGGFEISLKSTFSNGIGSSWLEIGGVWVMANIRGGREYGPNWHQTLEMSFFGSI
jgi:prolyl oligopeptidase